MQKSKHYKPFLPSTQASGLLVR